jgi:hypothetical protein
MCTLNSLCTIVVVVVESNERLVLHGLANCAFKILYSMNRVLIANRVATYISIGAI